MIPYSTHGFTRPSLDGLVGGLLDVFPERPPKCPQLRIPIKVGQVVRPKDVFEFRSPLHGDQDLLAALREPTSSRVQNGLVEVADELLALLVAPDVRANRRRRIIAHTHPKHQTPQTTTDRTNQ